jgi:predicted nucleotidyltransferase
MAVSVDDVARRLRRNAARREAEADARAATLRARLPAAAEILRDAGAVRVWLFGSLAPMPGSEKRFGPGSDVDLAVEGLPRSRYFDALAQVTEVMGVRVDLVDLASAPPSLRERVLTTGQLL